MNIKNINKNWLLLGGAVALGSAAVFLSNKAIHNRMAELEAESAKGKEMVTVVVPIKDLEKGTPLSPDVVAARQVPRQYAHAAAITPGEFDSYINQRISAPIKRGESLLTSHIDGMGDRVFSTLLTKGMRALTFEVDSVSSISGMLKPGDKVDLIFRAKSDDPGVDSDVIFPLLSNITVLATGQTLTKKTEEGVDQTFSNVTMEVSAIDADRILLARSAGTLTAVLRHPDDQSPNNAPRLSMSDLMSGAAKKKDRTIEFILGGGGTPGGVTIVSASTPSSPPSTTASLAVSKTTEQILAKNMAGNLEAAAASVRAQSSTVTASGGKPVVRE